MKRQEFAQIKVLDIKELTGKAKSLKDEIANLVLDKNMKKLKDLKSIAKKKRDLAKILTVVRQKDLLVQLESKAEDRLINKEVKEGKTVKTRKGKASAKL